MTSSVDTSESTTAPAMVKRNRSENLGLIRQIYPWAFLILLLVFFSISSKVMNNVNFLSARSIQGILEYTTQILLVGMAETFIIIVAGIDLSAGWTLGFSAVVGAEVMRALYASHAAPAVVITAGVLSGLLVALIPGILNGVLVARIKVPSFIATLGVGTLVEGIALLRSKGYPIADQPPYMGLWGNGYIAHYWKGHGIFFFELPKAASQADMVNIVPIIPNVVLVTLVVTIICWFILAKTQFGQHLYAIGGNFEASMRAGIPVQRTLIKVYALAGLLAGIAGVIWTARFTSGAYNAGETTPMTAIAAVVIGGASLFGGEGTIIGTIIGALIIATIQYGLVLLGVLPFWQYVAVGLVLILAVIMDQFGRNMGK